MFAAFIDNDFYIVDGDGHKLLVSETDSTYTVTQYNKNTEGTYAVGESVTYTYDADGNVTQIKRGTKTEATFTYSAGRITSITDNDNHTLAFTYEGDSKRICSVTESRNGTQGQTYSFERSINNVTIRTSGANGIFEKDKEISDDRLVTSRFSPELELLGESCSTASGDFLGAVSYEYGNNTQTASVFGDIERIAVNGKASDNLLKNHSLESEDAWTKTAFVDNDAEYTASVSTEKVYVGKKSFHVSATDFTKGGGVGYYQSFTPAMGVLKKGTNVASAYINAGNIIKDSDALTDTSYGAFVMVEIESPTNPGRRYSNPINNTGDNWERALVSFNVPEDFTEVKIALIVRNGTGEAYFDAAQLETGDYPLEYNMLENSSFNYVKSGNKPVGWTEKN